jgi:hypothetical protein
MGLTTDRVRRTPMAGRMGAWAAGLKHVFLWGALLAMIVALWHSREFVVGAWSTARPGSVLTAVVLWAAAHFVLPGISMLVLGWSKSIGYSEALAVHALRLPAKYLPGGVWHLVGRVADLKGLGHGRQSLAEFVLLENLVAASFALGVGAALLALSGEARWPELVTAVAVLGLMGLAAIPQLVKFVTRSGQLFPIGRYARILLLTAGFWSLASAAFVVFLSGFRPAVMQTGVTATVGTYLFSWGVGFVAFFAPQGVGVFEFVAGTLLQGKLDLSRAVALLASYRIIVLAGDLLAWAIAVVIFRRLSVR